VFAIAMTILVLELSLEAEIINTLAGEPGGNFWHTFTAIYAYVSGFIVLGIYWAFHHYMFHFIKRSNGVLVLAQRFIPHVCSFSSFINKSQPCCF